jgi:hypothetical protein
MPQGIPFASSALFVNFRADCKAAVLEFVGTAFFLLFWLGRDSSSNRRDRTRGCQAVLYNRASNVYRDVYGFESPRIGVALLSSYWRPLQPEHLARTSIGWCIGTCSFRTVLYRPVTWGDSGGCHLAFVDFCATIRQVSQFI